MVSAKEPAGAVVPPGVDGRSLFGLLRGEPWREDFLIENFGGPIVRPDVGVRTVHEKLIETLPDGFPSSTTWTPIPTSSRTMRVIPPGPTCRRRSCRDSQRSERSERRDLSRSKRV